MAVPILPCCCCCCGWWREGHRLWRATSWFHVLSAAQDDSRGPQHVAHTVRKREHRRPRPAAATSTYLLVDELPASPSARPGQAMPDHPTHAVAGTRSPSKPSGYPAGPATLINRTRSAVAVRICMPQVELQGKHERTDSDRPLEEGMLAPRTGPMLCG